jgi:hypothetical protein
MKKLLIAALLLALLPIVSAIDVSDCASLQAINNNKQGDYVLLNDIDCSGVSFTPIGNSNWNQWFQGTIDGNGYVVKNLNINLPGSSYVGFIGYLDSMGVVKDLGLENATIVGGARTGGFAGHSEGLINNSYVTGTVSTTGWNQIGGFVGTTDPTSIITDCYAQVTVTGNDNVGGFAGADAGIITNSYSAGLINANAWASNVGGFMGVSSGGVDSNNYWDTDVSGYTATIGTAVGKTTVQMKQEATFDGWDFLDTWAIEEGVIYPYLQAFGGVVIPNETSEYDAHLNYYIEHMTDGTYNIIVGDGVTYLEGDEYIPVILDFKPLDYSSTYYPDYSYGMESMKYKAVFKDTATAGQLVTFDSDELKVIYQPQFIGWINDWDSRANIASPQDSGFLNLNDSFVYPNAYGEGIDLTYQAHANYLKEAIIIDNRSRLTEPTPTMLQGGNVKFFVNFILDFDNEGDILINDEAWNMSGIVYTQEDIIVENVAGDVSYMIKKPYLIDADGIKYNGTYRVETANGVYFLMIQIPYDDIWNATFPITIDPTTGYNDTVLNNVTLNLSDDIFSPLERITLYNVSGDGDIVIDTNITHDLSDNIVYAYAIDPTQLEFEYGEADVRNATGNMLLKCVEWNIDTETCGVCAEYENDTCVDWNETWIFADDLNPGLPYDFTFDPVDPAYAEYTSSATESTTTGTTFVNKLSDSITVPTAGPHLIMVRGEITGSSTRADAIVRAQLDNTLTFMEQNHEPKDTTNSQEYKNFFGMTVSTLSSGSHTIDVDYRSESAGVVTYIRNVNSVAYSLDDYEYEYQESLAEQTITDTYVSYNTLTFTPSNAQDYVIYATGELGDEGANSRTLYVRLVVDGNEEDSFWYEPKDATDYYTFFMQDIKTLTATSHTIQIQARIESSTGSPNVKNLRIFALPVDEFWDYQSVEALTTSTSSTTARTTKATLSFTPEYPGDYLYTATAEISTSSGGSSGGIYATLNGADKCTLLEEQKEVGTADADWYDLECFFIANLTDTTNTALIQWNEIDSSSVDIRNARIIAYSLQDNGGAVCNPAPDTDWIISDAQICDAVTRTTGTGNIQIENGGSLLLINNAQVTTAEFPSILRWGNPWYLNVERGSKLIID